jgi:hypothetical protein
VSPLIQVAVQKFYDLVRPDGRLDKIWATLPDTPAVALAISDIGMELDEVRMLIKTAIRETRERPEGTSAKKQTSRSKRAER